MEYSNNNEDTVQSRHTVLPSTVHILVVDIVTQNLQVHKYVKCECVLTEFERGGLGGGEMEGRREGESERERERERETHTHTHTYVRTRTHQIKLSLSLCIHNKTMSTHSYMKLSGQVYTLMTKLSGKQVSNFMFYAQSTTMVKSTNL